MICYLCKSTNSKSRKGKVRDNQNLQILVCNDCGLVFLSSQEHINNDFYVNSGMHGEEPIAIEAWLKETEWDDLRRFNMLKSILPNQKLLDLGCGAAGFLQLASSLTEKITGIELENRVVSFWQNKLNIVQDLDAAGGGYDLITAFHVIEHLPDPLQVLKSLAEKLSSNGQIIIEVPSSEDALLTLYDSDAFQRFTYWSQHLFLFSSNNLGLLAKKASLAVKAIQHIQRYPLSNHLYWLSKGKPGGHKAFSFIDSPELNNAYANALAAVGKTDTLVAYLELAS